MSKTFSMPILGIAQNSYELIKSAYFAQGLERALEVCALCFPTMAVDTAEQLCLGALRPVFDLSGNRIEGFTTHPKAPWCLTEAELRRANEFIDAFDEYGRVFEQTKKAFLSAEHAERGAES